jgi:serine/threonine-protein kinase
VDGRTLADLAAAAPLGAGQILDLASQVADALADAHARGLVHRDLKPSNLMMSAGGRVKVLDFGVACCQAPPPASPDAETEAVEFRRGPAAFVGTLPYASPEQATGRDVDARADIFSFGVLLYELASGRRPFGGDNPAQMLEAILRGDPPPFVDRTGDPRMPAFGRIVMQMIARDPALRPASAADLRDAFEALRASRAAAGQGLDEDIEPNRLAIAPFANISGSSEDDWLGAGLAETLIADAGQLEGVAVVPRGRFADASRTAHDRTGETGDALALRAARDLGARWLVTGGFQRAGDALRVTASLTDLAGGQIAGTSRVDGRLAGIFDLQDRLVRDLAGQLRTAVTLEAPAAETRMADAYEAFSRGVLNRRAESFESLDRAVWFFERAVAIDPSYAQAHLELGNAYGNKGDYLSIPELHERAIASLRRALELQPSSLRAWQELGTQLLAAGRPPEAAAAIQRALAIEPSDAPSCAAMGRLLFIGYGRFGDASRWYERALAANPGGGWYALQRAHCAALARDFESGVRAAERAVELQEAFLSGREGLFIAGAYIRMGHLDALQGRHAEAVRQFDREIDFLTRTEHPLRHRILVELNTRLGASYAQLGDWRKADALFSVALESFDRRVRLGADDAFTRYYAAAVHAMRGDAEPALAYLERAAALQPAFTAARARIEPEFERLRGDPRFAAWLRRVRAVPAPPAV